MSQDNLLKKNMCKCNRCGVAFPVNIQEAVIEDRPGDQITEQYFLCLRCGKRYTICIYDNYMRKRIAKRQQLPKSKDKKRRRLVKEMHEHFKELKIKYGRE